MKKLLLLLLVPAIAHGQIVVNKQLMNNRNGGIVQLSTTTNADGSMSLNTIGAGTDYIVTKPTFATDRNGAVVKLSGTFNNDGTFSLSTTGGGGGGGGGTPGGSNTQVQYNNSGAFGGISGATTNGTTMTLNTPVFTGLPTGSGVSASSTASTLQSRDSNANSVSNNFLGGYTTTATAAATTTLTVGSTYAQFFTGTTTQTVVLPVTSTLATGQQFFIVNQSTGLVTVNSSGGNATVVLPTNTAALLTCILTSGTTQASWSVDYGGFNVASGKVGTLNNSITFNGTDNTTMTFPSTSATIARTDAANTFTGIQTFGAVVGTTWNGNTWPTGTGTLSIAAGKTFTDNNNLTLAGTDGSTLNIGGGGTLGSNAYTSTAYAPLASPALTGNPTAPTQASTDNSTRLATTAYTTTAVTSAIAGVNPAVAVQAATTAAGDTSGLAYNNGVAGIGAFFTGSNATAITIDGFTFTALGQRLLVKNDTQSPSGAFNGIYYVTQLQTIGVPPILTRVLDYDQSSDINNTGAIPVVNGTVNASTSWLLTSSVTTVGNDPLTYVKFSINPTNVAVTNVGNTFTGVSTGTSWNMTTPVITGGLTASGSGANDFSGSSGTFKTSTGAVTLGNGAIAVSGIETFSAAPVFASVVPTATGTGGLDLSGGSGVFKTSTGADTIGPGAVGITGVTTFTPPVRTSGSASYLTVNAPADTGLATTVESIGINHVGATRTWVDGTTAVQREYLFDKPTYNKTTTSAVFTKAATLAIDAAPVAGTGVTITNAYALWVQTGISQFDGSVTLGGGATASGSTAVDLSGDSGAFKTTTGAVTIGPGAIGLTGVVTLTPPVRSSGTASYFTLNIPADTSQTAATESIGLQTVTATRQWASTGTVALQRENFFAGPTYSSASASQTFTDAFTLYATPPIAGSNAIFTRDHTLGIVDATSASSATTGGVVVATTLGTAATSVGIGGGKVNAGTSITAPAFVGTSNAGIFNFAQAQQSQVVVSGTEYYITRSDLDMPATYSTAIGAGTTMRWRLAMTKTAAGTGTFQILLKKGTNGSTADTTIATATIGTQTAVLDALECDVVLTWTSTTAAYWNVIPRQFAATGTGFGFAYPVAAQYLTGTISAQTTTTASDKYGLSFVSTTGTPTILISEVTAQAYGVN